MIKRDWGTIFRNALCRGFDHGYAAWLADEWEKRQKKKAATNLKKGEQKK